MTHAEMQKEEEVMGWMSANKLQQNPSKMAVLLVGCNSIFGLGCMYSPSSLVCNLGILLN